MTTQHTPGKLSLFIGRRGKVLSICFGDKPNGATPCVVNWPGFDSNGLSVRENRDNARRLVACWNACDGLTTEHLENIDMLGGTLAGRFAAFHASERELMDTRDELLEALKGLLSGMFDGPDESDAAALVTKARAAIAKAEGAA